MQIKPKKKLGQNFLTDNNIQKNIAASCDINSSDIILEIGSGRGELTGLIAKSAGFVFAVEIDQKLSELLKTNLGGHKNITIINKDFLKVNLKLIGARFNKKLKIIGNIPYYITSPIIEHLIKNRSVINTVFLTVQKEFAKRIIATKGGKDYSSFSCFVQYYTDPKILFTINKNCFFPRPKVDSAFISLSIKESSAINPNHERRLFKIIRSSFNQRRKTLRNSLKYVIPRNRLESFFQENSINPNTRPEELSLADFINLSKK